MLVLIIKRIEEMPKKLARKKDSPIAVENLPVLMFSIGCNQMPSVMTLGIQGNIS
jgi:hypothetical protein